MKKLNTITIALLLSSFCSVAQTKLILIRPADSKTWGYANEKGIMVISPQFAKAFSFSEDGLAVNYDVNEKKYCFINTKGEKLNTEVTELKLKLDVTFGIISVLDYEGFFDGLAAVNVDKKWGFLNTKGRFAIQPKYTDIKSFSEGFASVKLDDKIFFIDKIGKEYYIKTKEQVLSLSKFTNGLASFKTKDGKHGFIDKEGTIIIQPIYKSVGYFVKGLAWVKTFDDLIGYINTTGEMVIKPQFTGGKNFEDTGILAQVKTDKEWFYINSKGTPVKLKYENKDVGDFSEGFAWVKINEKRGFINTIGEIVIQPNFDAVKEFHNGYAAVKIGEHWGLINSRGEVAIPIEFGGIRDLEIIK